MLLTKKDYFKLIREITIELKMEGVRLCQNLF
jgi:hypothetical protein